VARIGELIISAGAPIGNSEGPRKPAAVRYRRVAFMAAIALTGHVAALTWASSSVAPAGGRSSATATLKARVIEDARAAPAALTSDSSAATSLTVASPRDVGAPFHTERTAKKAEPDRSISAPVPAHPSTALPINSDGLLLDYLPRGMLSRAPAPQSSIEIPFPPEIDNEVHLTAALSLFIDETGVVQQVRIDSPILPPPMEEAARTAFLRARFSPGEVEGRPVRSLVRVEVTFDADVAHSDSAAAP